MRYLFQSTCRPISHRNGWTFRVYMILFQDFVPEWNSRPRIRTRENSRQGESCQHNILWWYHVNKYRAMRGNQSELAPGRKSPQCHVNTPWVKYMCSSTFQSLNILCILSGIVHTVNKKTIPYSIGCLQEVKQNGKDINCQAERCLWLLMTGSHLWRF